MKKILGVKRERCNDLFNTKPVNKIEDSVKAVARRKPKEDQLLLLVYITYKSVFNSHF